MEKDSQYSSALQQQHVNKQRQMHSQYAESLIEKRVNDDLTKAIADEDERELRQKREQTEIMRNEMITFQKERIAAKEKQKEINMMEDRKIEGQVQFAFDRNCAWDAEKDRKINLKDESDDKICTQMLADVAIRQEHDDDVTLHQEQECSERIILGDIMDRANLERFKTETKEGLLSQIEDKKNSVKEEKQRDADFKKSADLKMAEDDEKEKEKERLKKEKNAQYFADLQKQIQDNAARQKKEKEEEEERCKHEYYQHW